MTETAVKPENTTEAEETKPAFDLSTLEETDRMLFDKAEAAVKDYNKNITELKSLSGDVNEVAESIRNSDDPDIKSLVEAVEKAQATLTARQAKLDEVATEKAKAKIAENTDTERVAELETLTEKTLKKAKSLQNALVQDYGDAIKSAFTAITGKRSSSSGGTGKGAGVPRPRNFTVKVDGKVAVLPNANQEKVSSFSAAAKVIGCDTKTVQNGYFAVMGTDPNGWVPNKSVTYKIESEGKTYTVEATKNKDDK